MRISPTFASGIMALCLWSGTVFSQKTLVILNPGMPDNKAAGFMYDRFGGAKFGEAPTLLPLKEFRRKSRESLAAAGYSQVVLFDTFVKKVELDALVAELGGYSCILSWMTRGMRGSPLN